MLRAPRCALVVASGFQRVKRARGPHADVRTSLRAAGPLLPTLLKFVEGHGLRGFAAALCEAMRGIPASAAPALGEHYATDSDSLAAFLTPFGPDSCLSPLLEHETCNAPALVEFIANPGIRMDWTFSGENARTRQLMRKVELTTPNAPHGAAIVLDVARGADSQQNLGTPREHKLASRCALAKAKAMQTPLVSAMPGFAGFAHESGFTVLVPQGGARVVLDGGLTWMHHAETMPAGVYGAYHFDAAGKLALALKDSVIAVPPCWSPP